MVQQGVLVFKLLLLASTGLCYCHDTIPDRLWPLTNYTGQREVRVGGNEANISSQPEYIDGEPGLGYKALNLYENTVNLTIGDYVKDRKAVTFAAMFHWNPSKNADFFHYFRSPEFFLKVYSRGSCSVYIEGPKGQPQGSSLDPCIEQKGWYNIVVRWDGGVIEVYVMEAIPDIIKAEKRGKYKAEHLFDDVFCSIPDGGVLSVGPVPGGGAGGEPDGGAVSCLRVYLEKVDEGHAQEQMREDCQEKPSWSKLGPNPCGSKPCKNGGTCDPDAGDAGYICSCRPWFTGKDCTTELPMTAQGFRLVGTVNLEGYGEPIPGHGAIRVRGRVECSTMCLQVNMCMSYTYCPDSKLCSLYEQIFNSFANGSAQYYVETGLKDWPYGSPVP